MRIGRKTRIDQLDAANFTETFVEAGEIFIGEEVKKYFVLTNHRTNKALYRFEARHDGVYMVISNPEEFWKLSRYLIVEVK